MIATITANVISRVSTLLGATYSKLSFADDLNENKWARAAKRYSVVPKSANVTDGVLGSNMIDHRYEITLTDTFSLGPTAALNDDLKIQRINELQDNALLIYRDLQNNKTLLSSSVLIVSGLSINDAVILQDEKIVVIKFELIIKYKV